MTDYTKEPQKNWEKYEKREEVEAFLKHVMGCDIQELYSLLLVASWSLRDRYETLKQEKYLKKSERLKELYIKLYPYVFDFF